jgi:His-Xaa-Ser system radical SAM maturase HxsC
LIALQGRAVESSLAEPLARTVWRVVSSTSPKGRRTASAYLLAPDEIPPGGFDLYLCREAHARPVPAPWLRLPSRLDHLGAGDIIAIDARGQRIRVLWRANSRQNSVLLTERCDHYCLMCSQPPKLRDDSWLIAQTYELIRLLPRTTTDIAFTGGEPTLYGDELIGLLRLCRNLLPFADVHMLSNGRRFADSAFSASYAGVRNPRMMVGIPIYGAEATSHDHVVQSAGAFDETVRGLLTLGDHHQRIELRVVLHRLTVQQLPAIAEFIARNLPFVEHVALMGLEPTGLARANMPELWIDPVDYQTQLLDSVELLARRRVKTMVFNLPLCVLDRRLWPFATRSISDWKNEFHPECERCSVANSCAGFFHSAKYRMTEHVRAISAEEAGIARQYLELAGT